MVSAKMISCKDFIISFLFDAQTYKTRTLNLVFIQFLACAVFLREYKDIVALVYMGVHLFLDLIFRYLFILICSCL